MGDTQPNAHPTIPDLVGPIEDARIDVELFVRSLAPFATRQTQERLIDRLEGLRAGGVLDSLSVRVWGDAVRTDGAVARAGDGETAADRITEFFSHAADAAWSVTRYFRVASDRAWTDDGARDRIVPPQRCLSVRRDGELVAVFPCDVGDDRYRPRDALAYLEGECSDRSATHLAQD